MSKREPMRTFAAILAAAFLLGALSGCTTDKEELEQWIADMKTANGNCASPISRT